MNFLMTLKRGSPAIRPDGISTELVLHVADETEARDVAKFATDAWMCVDLDDVKLPRNIAVEGFALGGLNPRRGF